MPYSLSHPMPLRLEKKHPLAIRWFHWINFPVLAVMVWSGALIYWANPIYHLGPILLYNDKLFKALGLDFGLAQGMAWHFLFMWVFAVNGVAYVLYILFSGQWRHLVPGRGTLKEAWHVVLHDLRIRKVPPPRRKFNGAQRIAYTSIVVMGFISLLTGLAIYKPVQVSWLTGLFGGYPAARFIHFWLTVGFCLFFLVHLAQVVRAGWNNFRAMLTGYELVRVEGDEKGTPPPEDDGTQTKGDGTQAASPALRLAGGPPAEVSNSPTAWPIRGDKPSASGDGTQAASPALRLAGGPPAEAES